MRVIEIISDLRVVDTEGARDFYSGYLGLSHEEFNMGWVARYTSPETGAHLQLVTHDAAAPENPVVSVKVDDVEAAYEEARQRGYEIVYALQEEPWGRAPVLRPRPRRQRPQHRAPPRVGSVPPMAFEVELTCERAQDRLDGRRRGWSAEVTAAGAAQPLDPASDRSASNCWP